MRFGQLEDRWDPGIVRIRTIWLALALSLLVHLAALWEWLPRMRALNGDLQSTQVAEAPLAVRLAPRRSASSTPAAPPIAAPRVEARPRARRTLPKPAVPKAVPPPPVIATAPPQATTVPVLPEPTPMIPPPTIVPAPPPPPTAPNPAVETDLSSYIAARRRERGESPPTPSAEERENARRDEIVAANLAPANAYGSGQAASGGMFTIVRMGDSDGEFLFRGWSTKVHGRISQRIEVRRGSEPDMHVAMIRQMIAIIREYEQDYFVWRSRRLGRDITLSARVSDNDELEGFLKTEFFDRNGQLR